jgi:hypothetical protein
VTTWADVDALKAAIRTKPAGEWRAFAVLVLVPETPLAKVRVRGRAGDPLLKLERPCFHRPGAWRAAGKVRASHLPVDLASNRKLTSASRAMLSREAVLNALRVAHDEWLSAGCPRRTRLQRIEVSK